MVRRLAFLLLATACSKNGPYIPPPIADAGPHSDAGPRPDAREVSDAAPAFPDGANDPRGPDNVAVTAPAASATILTTKLGVTCHAEPDAMTMSPVTGVEISVTDRTGASITASAAPDTVTDWSATVDISTLANGPLEITCTATADDGKASSATIKPLLDLGPRVTVNQPSAAIAVHGVVLVDFIVTKDPIMSGDTMDGVTTVIASIAGVDISSSLANSSNHFTTSLRTDDPMFSTPLDGPQAFVVKASDARGATRTTTVIFTVDNDGPTVSIDKPAANDLVGGLLTVTATVTDPSGVDRTSVVAVVGDLVQFPLADVGSDQFSGEYDLAELRRLVEAAYPGSELVSPTISVRARDLPGNEGANGVQVDLDYEPPVASLDSPAVREGFKDTTSNQTVCSWAFDPLGMDAVDDGQTVEQLSEIRARVVDHGNDAPSASDVTLVRAGVDPAEVKLFVLARVDMASSVGDALVVDTDGDGICDDVNPMLAPTSTPSLSTDALELDLEPVGSTGLSFFASGDPSGYAGYPGCNPPAQDPASAPPALCQFSTGIQRIIQTPISHENEIYAIQPTPDSCAGRPFDQVSNNIPDGWACVAVRVKDKLGNIGVSAPMHVCFNHDGSFSGCPALPTYAGSPDVPDGVKTVPKGTAPFDCLGTYTPPTSSTPESTNATATCTPKTFPANEASLRTDF